MSEHIRDGHYLDLSLEEGNIKATMQCPYQGQDHTGTPFDDLHNCLKSYEEDGRPMPEWSGQRCLASEWVNEEGAHWQLNVPGSFDVRQVPVMVEYWWDGDSYQILPYREDQS